MLKHCVFLSIRADAADARLERAMQKLAGLVGKVEGMLDFAHGPNLDFEKKSQGHGYGFIATFSDRSAHLVYEQHPQHQEAGAELIAMCNGGYDGIVVYDLSCATDAIA
jgi:hypothetical protein